MKISAECFPVADFIEEEMAARGWAIRDVVDRMGCTDELDWGVNHLALEFLFACRSGPACRIGEMAVGLGRAFGTGPQIFRNIEKTWIDWCATKRRIQ